MILAGRSSPRCLLGLGLVMVQLGLACARQTPAERLYAAALARDRTAKDAAFARGDGPLTPAQRAVFRGLRYYAPDRRWRVEARFEPAAASDTLQFPTSQGTFDPYLHAGTLHFELAGQSRTLQLYRAPVAGHWFLPFTDATTGRTTYGAGRYLEVEVVAARQVQLDFNRAYNPYCAYNPGWICPLAPPENRLALRIEAGERSYDDGH